MKAYKGFLAIILTMAMILSMGIIGVGAREEEASDPTSPEVVFEQYINNGLLADMYATGKPWYELVDAKSQELSLSDEKAFEIGINTGIYRYYTKDELPLPETKPVETSEATEVTTAEVTETTQIESVVTEPVETTEALSDATEATDPTEVIAPESESTDPTESVPADITEATEQTEATESSETATAINTDPTAETTVPSSSDAENTETNRYYFYYPEIWESTNDEKTVGIYWWDASDAPTAWPGYEANKADVEGVFYYDVPKDVTTIIWNNFIDGGTDPKAEIYKLAHQTTNIGTEYYDPYESDTYPDGVESFDGMIFVIDSTISCCELSSKHTYEGEWYYYYGNGEYGITPEKGDKVYTDSYLDEPIVPDNEFATGDVNRDGKLNIKDATAIQKYVAKMTEFDETQQALADYNADGKVNIKDATMIQKKIANLI